jgi:glutamine amidotransferase
VIALIDYGRGNLGSVEKAFRRIGMPATITQDPRSVDEAEAVVLPGDGAFHDAMANLERLGLTPAVRRALDGSRPFLGICLGYQIPHMGWNRVEHAGDLRLFDGIPSGAHFYFVHSFYPVVAGALSLVVAGTASTASAEGGLREERVAPHARSTVPNPSSSSLRAAWCDYGVRFAAAIEVGRIHATQFHPEKSQRWGIRMLENFAAVVKSGR